MLNRGVVYRSVVDQLVRERVKDLMVSPLAGGHGSELQLTHQGTARLDTEPVPLGGMGAQQVQFAVPIPPAHLVVTPWDAQCRARGRGRGALRHVNEVRSL
ncbi:MAG: hypothetical protein JKY23_04375 [Nitrospinaceae bacterium]|nr:hypothetical protein [Nitrospinaceae bacterium]